MRIITFLVSKWPKWLNHIMCRHHNILCDIETVKLLNEITSICYVLVLVLLVLKVTLKNVFTFRESRRVSSRVLVYKYLVHLNEENDDAE